MEKILNYVVLITNLNKATYTKKIFGPFSSVEEIKQWLKDKYNSDEYVIDIFPVNYP